MKKVSVLFFIFLGSWGKFAFWVLRLHCVDVWLWLVVLKRQVAWSAGVSIALIEDTDCWEADVIKNKMDGFFSVYCPCVRVCGEIVCI
jgi:hypothetical protein